MRGCASGTASITFAVFALNCYYARRRQQPLWVTTWKWSIPVNFTAYHQKRDLDVLWGPGFTPGDQLALFIWNKRTLLEIVPEASQTSKSERKTPLVHVQSVQLLSDYKVWRQKKNPHPLYSGSLAGIRKYIPPMLLHCIWNQMYCSCDFQIRNPNNCKPFSSVNSNS